jgi:hypothetical protein
MLRSDAPFSMEARTEPWAVLLLAIADGSRSAMECLADLKSQGALPESVPPNDFARAVAVLVSGEPVK